MSMSIAFLQHAGEVKYNNAFASSSPRNLTSESYSIVTLTASPTRAETGFRNLVFKYWLILAKSKA